MFSCWTELSLEELERFNHHMELVIEAAKGMAVGMLKGIIKYPADCPTTKQWLAHLVDEGFDQINYTMLLLDAWRKET